MSEETNRFGDEKKKILPITTFQVLDRLNTLQWNPLYTVY